MENSNYNQENVANVTSVEPTAVDNKRAMQAKNYGMWYKEGATASDLVSWCNTRIAIYTEWIKNCQILKIENQRRLVEDMSEEELREILEAKIKAANK